MSHVPRRQFLIASGAMLAASVARAQKPGRLPALGILSGDRKPTPEQIASSPVTAKLKELGWTEGKTLLIERAFAGGRDEHLPDLAAELVRKRVDVIWAIGPPAAIAAARATKTIPIVFWGVNYPDKRRLVETLARPGRNVTGVTVSPGLEMRAKQLELLKEIAPTVTRVAWITSLVSIRTVAGDEVPEAYTTIESAARELGIDLRNHRIERSEDLDAVFPALLASRAQAIGTVADPLTWRERQRIIDFANQNRLASTFDTSGFIDAGGLFSYGPDTLETVLRSLTYVDRILRGARPEALPVEQPDRYYLTINLKTAKALGITIPPSILLRADRVIE